MRKIIKPCGFHCIKVNHLGVQFNDQVVLEDVNLHIHCGSLNAVIGKNGAGKSTTFSILATLLQPSNGDVLVNGQSVVKDSAAVRANERQMDKALAKMS